MGLADKAKIKKPDQEFTSDEIKFILTKLRSADYKGSEFETFFNIYTKLQGKINLK